MDDGMDLSRLSLEQVEQLQALVDRAQGGRRQS